MQQDKAHGAVSEVPVRRQHIGLGGYVPNEEDTEMPDIMREKFPDGVALTGMLLFQCNNSDVLLYCASHVFNTKLSATH